MSLGGEFIFHVGLSRAAARRKEISVRLSLGASRLRLIRQLLTESVLLAMGGGAAGLIVGNWSRQLLPIPAAAAPFVGLFGTVWGIMGAFRDIYAAGNANLATVARPISEALIATAVGLFAAVPALVAYNGFNSRIRVLENEMRNFSSDFLNIIKRHIFKKAA